MHLIYFYVKIGACFKSNFINYLNIVMMKQAKALAYINYLTVQSNQINLYQQGGPKFIKEFHSILLELFALNICLKALVFSF
jgi:hypothetical protein